MSKFYDKQDAYRPFRFPWAVELTKTHEEIHWTESEIKNLNDDLKEWRSGKLNQDEKNLITQILRMFTQQDIAVGDSYVPLVNKIKNNELRCMWYSFMAREAVHQRSYALINDTLGLPETEYSAFLEYSAMKDKWEHFGSPVMTQDCTNKFIDLMMEGFDGGDSIHPILRATEDALSLARICFAEGISLFASFIILLNFRRAENGGKLKGVGDIVAYSIKDENMHVEGNAKVFKELCAEYPMIVDDTFKKSIYEEARQVVKLEDKFIDLVFKESNIRGIDKEDVKKFIRYLADRRLIQLGLKGNWKVKDNPLPWLDILLGDKQEMFFETTVTSYSKNNLSGNWDDSIYESLE